MLVLGLLEQLGLTGYNLALSRVKTCVLLKEPMGALAFHYDIRDDIFVCSWNDNYVVTLALNDLEPSLLFPV